ncbi:hypothetical protein I4U23_005995 [Adineta vaga]|nr:hypothetical protein I4U23_005995 [Adineta vaga]
MSEEVVPERFLDAANESKQNLGPIRGFETYPLVSLIDSIEPIKYLLYDADTMIKTARRNSQNPADGLTQEESAAIRLYTMQWPKPYPSLYTLLNERLRSAKRESLKPWFPYLKLFLTALSKLPSIQGIIWRGVRENVSDQYVKKQIWWGISSCTTTMPILEKFIGTNGIRTIFNIECIYGKAIQSHSYFKKENEIILLPGSSFEVVGKWKAAEDLYMIQLKENTPSFSIPTSSVDLIIPSISVSVPNQSTLARLRNKAKYIIHKGVQEINQNPFYNQSNPCDIQPESSDLGISTPQKHKEIYESFLNKLKAPIPSNGMRKQQIITIAGGNGKGCELNQLSGPQGIFVNEEKTVYITDFENDRIVEWKSDEKLGRILVGGNGQLNRPIDLLVDKQNNSLIISDQRNQRVIRWLNQYQQEILIENIDCYGLTMDKLGFIYVSDYKNDQIIRLKHGEHEQCIVAGGNGKGSELNQLNGPTFLFINENQSIYISDSSNNRVMKWKKRAKEGIIVAGGNGDGKNLNQLDNPQGIVVDHKRRIYISDCWNNRIMCWYEESKESFILLGGKDEDKKANKLSCPRGLSIDCNGNLYIVDMWNHRIIQLCKYFSD